MAYTSKQKLALGGVSLLSVAAMSFGLSGVSQTEAATSSPAVSDDSLTADPAGRATWKSHSNTCFKAYSLGVGVRDASGKNLDYPGFVHNVNVCPVGYTFVSDPRTPLPPGTYTVFGAYQEKQNGPWKIGPKKDLTVSAPSSSPTPTPTPTTASPTPSPSPSSSTTADAGLTFSDDFNIPVPEGGFTGCQSGVNICSGLPAGVKEKWFAYPDGWKDTSKNGTYSPSKVISIANGMMHLRMRNENGVNLVSAPMPLTPTYGQQYGTYEVRWYIEDPTPGFKIAWLLWPNSEVWPRDGEIDFPEGDMKGTIDAFMHRQNGTSGGDQDAYSTGVPVAGGWHTTKIDWRADHLDFYLDGKLIGRSTSRIPNTPMHWVIQSETSLSGTTPASGSQVDVYLDYVKIWK